MEAGSLSVKSSSCAAVVNIWCVQISLRSSQEGRSDAMGHTCGGNCGMAPAGGGAW